MGKDKEHTNENKKQQPKKYLADQLDIKSNEDIAEFEAKQKDDKDEVQKKSPNHHIADNLDIESTEDTAEFEAKLKNQAADPMQQGINEIPYFRNG